MPTTPTLEKENILLGMLTDSTRQFLVDNTDDELLARVATDWLESLDDNRVTNDEILKSDAGPMEQDLLYESWLLDVFLTVINGSAGSGSALSERLRERWQDLFNREIERNREIIDATK